MSPELWKKVKEILDEALERESVAERAEFVAAACSGNRELQHEVESLLAFHAQPDELLEESAMAAASRDFFQRGCVDFIGRELGKYKILSELGAGGMGAVYLAQRSDGAFEQKVAIKLIKRGMDSEAILRRFHLERQILASLEHPNIARLIDGGTTEENLPYFVMEYVEGAPIIDFAEQKNLTLIERLDLFRAVCSAVAYAHRHLIIHRDLKPSNILVTDDGKPKLLDFGIAKLIKSENDNETATQHFIFTPEYASPEQVRGEKLTTATDVYSLGVILYELLAGCRPYKIPQQNIGQIIRAVCETIPTRPSVAAGTQKNVEPEQTDKNRKTNDKEQKAPSQPAVRNPQSLRGDLDNIVLKALRKEPERRYSSVEQFSEDIRRHLRGLPVFARSDTFRYRAEKFVRRNPLSVAAIILAFLSLLGGFAATTHQAFIARRERELALRRFNDVRHLANSFMFEINEEIERSPVKARELLVRRALEYLDKLAAEAESDRSLQSEIATAYEKIGDVQAKLYGSNIGDSAGAIESYRKALLLRKSLFAADSKNVEEGLNLAGSFTKMGEISAKTGNIAAAVENHREAVSLNEKLAAQEPENLNIRRSLTKRYSMLGQALLRTGALSEVLENYRKAQKIYQDFASSDPSDAKTQYGTAVLYTYIGFVLDEMGDLDGSLENYKQALATTQRLLEQDPTDEKYLTLEASSQWWIAYALCQKGDFTNSLEYHQKSLKAAENFFNEDPNDIGKRNNLADCFLELGNTFSLGNRYEESLDAFNKAINHYEIVWKADAGNAHAKHQIAYAKRSLGNMMAKKGDWQKALEAYSQSLEIVQELSARDPNNSEWKYSVAACLLKIGETNLARGDQETANQRLQQALPLLEKLAAESPASVHRIADLQRAREALSKLHSSLVAKISQKL